MYVLPLTPNRLFCGHDSVLIYVHIFRFGQAGAVAPLVNYLTSSSIEVHRSTSVALYQLSKDPWNCVTMHQSGVVPHLLRLIGMTN